MPKVKDVILFIRAVWCHMVIGDDLKEGWASIATSDLLPIFHAEKEEYGIRYLAFEELRKRSFKPEDEFVILQAFLKLIDKECDPEKIEGKVLEDVCEMLRERSSSILLKTKIDTNRNKAVRLRLVKVLRLRDVYSEKIDNWLVKIALRDHDPEVRLAAAEALTERSGKVVIRGLASFLSHEDETVREASKKFLSATNDPCWVEVLYGLLTKEYKKEDRGDLQRISGLQEILSKRMEEWNMDFLLECLAEDAIPDAVLKAKAFKVLKERIRQQEFVSNEKLIAVFHQYRKLEDASMLIFFELSDRRQSEEVYMFLLDLAKHDSDFKIYAFALGAIERMGERARLREEIFFLPE